MNTNYQKEMETILNGLPGGQKPRLLLHSCCGPCSSYVLHCLAPYFDITLLFYNPNIHPETEYGRRKLTQIHLLERLAKEGYAIEFMDCDYQRQGFEAATAHMDGPEGGPRCSACFRLRLSYTAKYAKMQSFDYFATTLSVSPHKDAHLLNQIGLEVQLQYGVNYLCADFKKKGGYEKSIALSKLYRLYRQNYCGCEYSLRDKN